MIYTVDHYKPKSKAPALVCDYNNLFYCCFQCNTYKKDYWPAAKTDRRVINPCDDAMASHLRFDKESGEMVAVTVEGHWLVTLFRLNEDDAPRARRLTLMRIEMGRAALAMTDKAIEEVRVRFGVEGAEEQERLREVLQQLEGKRALYLENVQRLEGTLPLRQLSGRYII